LIDISIALKEYGLKVFFIGATSEFSELRRIVKCFDSFYFLNSSEYNNLKIIEKATEIIDIKEYNLLIVDDADYISDEVFNNIMNIKVRKIFTCLDINKNKFAENSKFLEITNEYIDEEKRRKSLLKTEGESYNNDDFIKMIIRDQKINSILND
jgi:hypothetical protein